MNNFKKVLAVVLAVLMVGAVFAACSAKTADNDGSDLAYIKDKGVMVIGITEYEPMNYKDANGEWTGFDTEFALAVCEKLGVKAEFQVVDWDNKHLELNAKSVDCIWNGMTLTPEVLAAMDCTDPYAMNAQVVVMAADKAANYSTVESLADLTFAVESGSAGEEVLTEAGLGDKATAVAAQSDALMEVASGSVDACVIDITMANAMTGEGTSYANLGVAVELNSEQYGIGFRKGSDAVAVVNATIQEMKADGTLQALAEKYGITLA